MIKIAIIEDNLDEQQRLLHHLERYAKEHHEPFQFFLYNNAVDFLSAEESFDIAFLDIMLPNLTGMQAAMRMRKYNSRTIIIFVTTIAKFALKSYEVDALDYVIKPVTYERLTLKLQKAIKIIESNEGGMLTINDPHGIVTCSTNNILFVEVHGHKLQFHTADHIYSEYGSLSDLEKVLNAYDFMRCNSCYLVNPQHIRRINNKELTVILSNNEELKISQPRRKSFIHDFTNYLGQGK